MTLSDTLSVDDLQEPDSSNQNWDINDAKFPPVSEVNDFDLWPQGHCRRVYSATCEEARRHTSGWAMRNTNNHNVQILKKSCLGVLLCSANCRLGPDGVQFTLRPAICDKARRKQCGRQCPNPICSGSMFLQPCRGHCGYPVTHLWRRCDDLIYFQAKGSHDHPLPDIKPTRDQKRRPAVKRSIKEEINEFTSKRSKFDSEMVQKCAQLSVYGDRLCSCPPFECLCNKATTTTDCTSPQPSAAHHRICTPSTLPGSPSSGYPATAFHFPHGLYPPTPTACVNSHPQFYPGPHHYYPMTAAAESPLTAAGYSTGGGRADSSMLSQLMTSPTYQTQHGLVHGGHCPTAQTSFGAGPVGGFNSSLSSTSPGSPPPGLQDLRHSQFAAAAMYCSGGGGGGGSTRPPPLQCSAGGVSPSSVLHQSYLSSAFSLLPGYGVPSSPLQSGCLSSKHHEEISGRFLDRGSASFHLPPLLYKS